MAGQDYVPGEAAEARIWLDRGDEPLLQRGDRVRIYYRTSQDAYVAIFQINTDGAVRLLHPRAPEEETFTRGGRDYRLLFSQSSYWFVDEYPGKGYYFMVASPEPFDLSQFSYARHERQWDLTQVGRAVYQDPYLAMDDYIARLLPDWETVPYALDFIAYDVGEVHEYPRFLCYDCHGFRSYPIWNPYTYACASFRVVVWDDPYFYASYRYQGSRVVYARPRRGLGMYEFKERAQGETWTPLIRTRQPPLRRAAEYVEPGAARPNSQPGWVPPRRATVTPSAGANRPSGTAAPTRRPSTGAPSAGTPSTRTPSSGAPAQRRGTTETGAERPPTRTTPPSSATPRSTSPSGRATPSSPPRSSGERPVLQRRPPTSGSSGGTRARPSSGARSSSGTGSSSTGRSSASSSGRPPSGSGVIRPPTGTTRARVPARASGGSSSRPTVKAPPARSSGGARSAPSRPPARRPAKPPPKRKPGGGSV